MVCGRVMPIVAVPCDDSLLCMTVPWYVYLTAVRDYKSLLWQCCVIYRRDSVMWCVSVSVLFCFSNVFVCGNTMVCV